MGTDDGQRVIRAFAEEHAAHVEASRVVREDLDADARHAARGRPDEADDQALALRDLCPGVGHGR